MVGYFGAFSKIQEIISDAATKVVTATSEIVKENSASKISLSVDVKTPVIFVPLNSGDHKNFLSLELGNISLRNKIIETEYEILDDMKIVGMCESHYQIWKVGDA